MNKKITINSIILDKYKIIKFLKTGGMDSNIYFAENISYSDNNYFSYKYRYAIVKLIYRTSETSNDQWIKYYDEATTVGRLSHKKNIVKLYDHIILDNDSILIIMEYIDGFDLSKYITNFGPLSINESLYIFKQILIAIKQLHLKDNFIIHRDLKPENILISKNMSKICLIDFGISSVVSKSPYKLIHNDNDDFEFITNEDSLYGTIPYMNPDIIKDRKLSDKDINKINFFQYDFFALGVIFYEMLVGEKPFKYKDDSDPKSIKFPLMYDFISLKNIYSNFPNDIENIIFRLLASKEEDIIYRYNNVNEILDDINRYELRLKNNGKEPNLLKPINKRTYQDSINNPKLKNNKNIWFLLWLVCIIFLFFTVFLLFILKTN